MEDEKIIGLYWNRKEQAILETSTKYGKLCFFIANRSEERRVGKECRL